jgi:hypothetical protein
MPVVMEKVLPMSPVHLLPMSPVYTPLYKGGIFSSVPLTPLWKRGEGEIFGRNVAAIMQRTSDTPH